MKIIFIFQIALVMIFSGCSFNKSDNKECSIENKTEITSQTIEAIEKTTLSKDAKTELIPHKITSKVEKLDLGKVDEWSFNSRSKFIYFTDYGRYYPVEIGGRNSANYVLCFDEGNDNPKILTETENYVSYYCNQKAIYISKYNFDNHVFGIYKVQRDKVTALKEITGNMMYNIYFDDSYIYYTQLIKGNNSIIYRMDYEGNNCEIVLDISDDNIDIFAMMVYNNKIWYEYVNRSSGDYTNNISCFDLTTGENTKLKNGEIGLINNGFMYYTSCEEPNKLIRFNLSKYEDEVVINNDKILSAFDFYGDHILYSSGDLLYKYSDNENTPIFSIQDYFEDESYRIREIQCQDNRIFIKIGSGAFCQCIIEIDIDGNVIELIHED